MLERHPKGSQAFIPLQQQKFLIIVAPALDENTPDISKLCAFISNGKQSINYRAGTWHHPLLTFEAPSDFCSSRSDWRWCKLRCFSISTTYRS